MRVLALCLTLLVFAQPSFPNNSKKKSNLLEILNKDIDYTLRILRKKEKPTLLFKLILNYRERTRLLKEKENEALLKVKDPRYIKKVKSSYFKESRKDLVRSLRALNRLKKYNSVQYYPEAYYSVALMHRDFNEYEKAIGSLEKAVSYPIGSKSLKSKIYQLLGDSYYNQERFNDALEAYRKIIGDKTNRWRTKLYLNVSWIFLKRNDKKRAIRYLKATHKFSKSKIYEDFSYNVIDVAPYFFAYFDLDREGLVYINNISDDKFSSIKKLLHHKVEFGRTKDLGAVLSALQNSVKTKEDEYEYRLIKLKSFHQTGQTNTLTKEILKLRVPKYWKSVPLKSRTLFEEFIRQRVSVLQERLYSKRTSDNNDRTKVLKIIISFFDVLQSIAFEKAHEYSFMQGEAYFSRGEYSSAINKYMTAIKMKEQTGKPDPKYYWALFSLFDQVSFKTKRRSVESSYINYLKHFPKAKKSDTIYEKLFQYQFKNRKYDKGLLTSKNYVKYFPAKREKQRTMLTHLFDKFSEKDDHGQMSNLLKFSKYYRNLFAPSIFMKMNSVLSKSMFVGALKALKGKNSKEGERLLRELYVNSSLDKDVRLKAIVKLLLLSYEGKRWEEVDQYFKDFLSSLESYKDFKEFDENIYFVVNQLLLIGKMDLSSRYSYSVFNTIAKKFNQFARKYYKNFVSCEMTKNSKVNLVEVRNMFDRRWLSRSEYENVLLDVLASSEVQGKISNFVDVYQNARDPRTRKAILKEIESVYLSRYSSPEVGVLESILQREGYSWVSKLRNIGSVKRRLENTNLSFLPSVKIVSDFNMLQSGLGRIIEGLSAFNEQISNELKTTNPVYQMYIIESAIKKYDEVEKSLSSYSPNTKDPNLSKSFKTELSKMAHLISLEKEKKVAILRKAYLDSKISFPGLRRAVLNTKAAILLPHGIRVEELGVIIDKY